MTEEEQFGVPPLEVIRQVLADNRPLVRLLAATCDDNVQCELAQLVADVGAQAETPDVLISTYREVLELLEILSATSVAGTASTRCFDADSPDPASETPKNHAENREQ